MTTRFDVIEHTSPGQHIREFPHGSKNENVPFHLAIKEYRPKQGLSAEEDDGAVTIIACHGNGFVKECYEPLWDELLDLSHTQGFKIRAIWIADAANQGKSYAYNEDTVGDDPSWLDHSRDMLLMINNFRDRMVAPLVGLGHSMGCTQLIYLSALHPRLLHNLILIEPILKELPREGPNSAKPASSRRETWPSRSEAEASLRTKPMFKAMNPRVLDAFLVHGLRNLSYKDDAPVTLATPKAQEAWSYVRPVFIPLPVNPGHPEAKTKERLLNPDFVPGDKHSTAVFTHGAGVRVPETLPQLRPRTLVVYAENSPFSSQELRTQWLRTAGTGRGGSGGAAEGAVREKIMNGIGHLACLEQPRIIATEIGPWLKDEIEGRWKMEREFFASMDQGKSVEVDGKKVLSGKWMDMVKKGSDVKRPIKGKL